MTPRVTITVIKVRRGETDPTGSGYEVGVSAVMRIGEILLLREALDPWVLTQTIQGQPASRQRLVSLLISRALIDPDDGTLALSEQQNYPGAMQRHLERRDLAVVDAIPAEVGRRWVVLPIGRSHRGALVVVARDPTPILAASLQHIAQTPIELAVTPAVQLERLIRSTYGELEVDESVPRELAPIAQHQLDIADLRLDGPDPVRRPRTISRMLLDTSPDLPRSRQASITKELDGTLEQIERAINRAAAEQHAMMFASRRWNATLLTTISDGAALGRRGHGARLSSVEGVILPIDAPSVIQLAYQTRTASAEVPQSAIQARLNVLLGDAVSPVAAPVIVGDQVVAVLVVGDPSSGELRNPNVKLAALADALGAAYERLAY